jgi:hypothetical protein
MPQFLNVSFTFFGGPDDRFRDPKAAFRPHSWSDGTPVCVFRRRPEAVAAVSCDDSSGAVDPNREAV